MSAQLRLEREKARFVVGRRSVSEDSKRRIRVGTDSGLFQVVSRKVKGVKRPSYAPLAIHAILEDREHRMLRTVLLGSRSFPFILVSTPSW
ncbi:MAG TPA: hypothetical protein VGR96_17865 [Acidobacteriaceae bacterium]|nr:hypothetical protein [Acidobacteriaceae bacterium]